MIDNNQSFGLISLTFNPAFTDLVVSDIPNTKNLQKYQSSPEGSFLSDPEANSKRKISVEFLKQAQK